MERRRLGNSGLEITPLVFGGNVFGWTVDEAQSFRLLDAFVAAGGTMVDTADVYSKWAPGNSGGESETIIGNWLARRGGRHGVLIATKCGMELGPDRKGLSRRWIVQAVEDSLRRLRTDVIDLYQSHKDDPETPLEETLEAHAQLVRQGKVRAIGASNYAAPRLAEALETSRRLGIPRYETLQPEYNLYDRAGFEGALQDLCVREGLGVIPYYSLASGFLTGKYRSEADLGDRARAAKARNYLNPRGQRVLAALDTVAGRLGATPAQVSLAWLMARPAIAAPIASATTVEQLDEIMGATRLRLDADAMALLDGTGEAG
ncbi:aldo/keto reductase [Roseomonas sp. NAR14]|uniref:Aldo/keto reductase n=1 Tax=Roseomonas acroporae TaxID=2937791 RepID=A0A9X2BWK9_9PROT|nr:aldo/keto reductase [Roseomonas acroporae]MCK8787797.1 aldo/keto reductase [Roseomonas acroporae]